MKVSQKDLKKSKDLVEKLLLVNGEKYNDWLYEQQQHYIESNQDTILLALSAFQDESKDLKEKPPNELGGERMS